MARVVSFVSYKGGAGRSVLLANVAYQLALQGKRVGCVDMDIEGGGLHRILGVFDNHKHSVQHFLMRDKDYTQYWEDMIENGAVGSVEILDLNEPDVFRDKLCINVLRRCARRWAVDARDRPGRLFLIQAQPDPEATRLVDRSPLMYPRVRLLLDLMADVLALDYVLVDCRSGISYMGLPGLAYCDIAMIVYRWGVQHRYGTIALVDWYRDFLEEMGRETKLISIPSTIKTSLIDLEDVIAWSRSNLELHTIKPVPYSRRLETDDCVLGKVTRDDERSTAEAFQHIAAIIDHA